MKQTSSSSQFFIPAAFVRYDGLGTSGTAGEDERSDIFPIVCVNARELVSLFCECEIRESVESQFPFLFCWWSMRPAETTETEEKGEGPEGAVIEGAPCPGLGKNPRNISGLICTLLLVAFNTVALAGGKMERFFSQCGRQKQKHSFC